MPDGNANSLTAVRHAVLRLSSRSFKIGTGGSNPLRSATESRLYGFSARIGEIARACGFICVMRGTGENYFPAVRAQDAAKVSVGK
jgi:hypothetical protein